MNISVALQDHWDQTEIATVYLVITEKVLPDLSMTIFSIHIAVI